MKNARLKIKIGDTQPIDCPKCKGKEGYSYSDTLQMHYTSHHSENGKYEGGTYSDYSRTLNKSTIAYCSNCNSVLPFRLKRAQFEVV